MGGLGRHLGSQPVLNVESVGGEQEVILYRQDYGRIYCAYTSQSPLKHLVIRQPLQIFNRQVSDIIKVICLRIILAVSGQER